ncbi:phosphoribosylformylglycinamidine cyclo-ligase [Rummeliibacillus stabekisii]|uniref:phosphoribosylformylglycinamidine cyclo-ligase n=1 Tax=Rummeliibacillus stabekisii TaxID=241244 RepID=UPI0011683AAB|nr:phosphoribosylformylglycinamidine cyclo-ligase [Rummeliibacillus stabekisii]MBB5170077.1 phosphoribosylformylglycinamidine cyclo-ligase [Rummeliibacillus stabekisii]GEL04336.1 phosphoribosylformylglycinamidine cyclo-ligase [Rummeliibacillus stabekisii]
MANAYKQAGVDIEAGYESVERMKKHVARTMRPEVMSGLGGFGGLFDLSTLGLKEPVLVSGTDGVGTKLLLAMKMGRHDTIGIDCVAMCVNDIVVQGAQPLYFLDYIALGKAVPERIEDIVKGIAEGCEQAGCALIGGETAEMPGMYDADEYDVAGFAVGACEKSQLITGASIQPGDAIIGLASSGIHSNGFSLVRKVVEDMPLDQYVEEIDGVLGDVLLTPTRIYVRAIQAAMQEFEIKGMAHITGGGFVENLPRMLPAGVGAAVKLDTWKVHPIFSLLQKKGQISTHEMYQIFNMGIGLAVIVKREDAERAVAQFKKSGEEAYIIGETVAGEGVSFA